MASALKLASSDAVHPSFQGNAARMFRYAFDNFELHLGRLRVVRFNNGANVLLQ